MLQEYLNNIKEEKEQNRWREKLNPENEKVEGKERLRGHEMSNKHFAHENIHYQKHIQHI